MSWLFKLLKPDLYSQKADAGLLILRLGAGVMMMTHGWPKLMDYSEKATKFYDFLGFGTEFTLILTIFAELVCSFLLMIGLTTRLVLIPLMILGLVIAFVVHGADPFGDKEHGLLFLIPYITLFLTGPGRYSLDYLFFNRKTS